MRAWIRPRYLKKVVNLVVNFEDPCLINYFSSQNEIFDVKNKTAFAFCGIGDPDSFTLLLEESGVKLTSFVKYRDHHNFTLRDIENILNTFEKDKADIIVTSQKDFVRIKNSEIVLESESDNLYKQLLFNYPLYYPKIKMQIKHNPEPLYEHLDKIVQIV